MLLALACLHKGCCPQRLQAPAALPQLLPVRLHKGNTRALGLRWQPSKSSGLQSLHQQLRLGERGHVKALVEQCQGGLLLQELCLQQRQQRQQEAQWQWR